MPKKKKRRVVRRKKTIPKVEELYAKAYELGMTVNEYVQYLNAMNSDKSRRRNNASMYDMGPIPYREKGVVRKRIVDKKTGRAHVAEYYEEIRKL